MNTTHIDHVIAQIRPTFEAVQTVIDANVKPDTSMKTEDLMNAVAKEMNTDINKDLKDLISLFIHRSPQGYVSPGANGGYKLGVRPAKPSKKALASTPNVAISSDSVAELVKAMQEMALEVEEMPMANEEVSADINQVVAV